jgi:hypothetical protein
MKDWIPFFQTLIWPALLVAVMILTRVPLARLLKAIEERIVAGAEFDVGASGIKVGAAPKLPPSNSPSSQIAKEAKSTGAPIPGKVYVVHTARRDRSLDRGEHMYFRVRIYLDADDPAMLGQVSEVIYYLHETFKEPIRIVRDRKTSFEVKTIIWGEFNAAATVRFKDGHEVKLERYLNI